MTTLPSAVTWTVKKDWTSAIWKRRAKKAGRWIVTQWLPQVALYVGVCYALVTTAR